MVRVLACRSSATRTTGPGRASLPSPIVLGAATAARPRRLRIRMAAVVAPFHDPLRLAEDLAVLDIVSGGRLDVTVGAGYVPAEFAMFDRDMRDRARLV